MGLTFGYYGRQYPRPAAEEAWYLIQRAEQEFSSYADRATALLADDAVPDYVATSIGQALDEVSRAFQAATSMAWESRDAIEAPE